MHGLIRKKEGAASIFPLSYKPFSRLALPCPGPNRGRLFDIVSVLHAAARRYPITAHHMYFIN